MVFIPGGSRQINTNPNTPASLRGSLSKLMRNQGNDRIDIKELQELAEQFKGFAIRPALANEEITIGEVVYEPTEGHIALASASDVLKYDPIGVALENIGSGSLGYYCAAGYVERQGWGLTTNAHYFLGTTAGSLVLTPVDAEGNMAIIIGEALSSTEFLVDIEQGIIL